MSPNTSSDARLVSKTLGRTFSVQPLVSTVLRSTWALWPIVRIAVLSKRASRSLAQTGFFFTSFSLLFSKALFMTSRIDFWRSKFLLFMLKLIFDRFFRAPSKSRGGPLGAILPFQGGQNRAPLLHFRRFFDFGPFPRDVKISLKFDKISEG